MPHPAPKGATDGVAMQPLASSIHTVGPLRPSVEWTPSYQTHIAHNRSPLAGVGVFGLPFSIAESPFPQSPYSRDRGQVTDNPDTLSNTEATIQSPFRAGSNTDTEYKST